VQGVVSLAMRDSDLVLELTRVAAHPVHRVPAYYFRMLHADTGEELGLINLRLGRGRHIMRHAGHVGYGVHSPHRGHRYAARSLRLLIPLARELGIAPLWITCDPENAASRRSAERAGATLAEIIDLPPTCVIARNGHPRKCRYRLD